jgi:hypothetical protein
MRMLFEETLSLLEKKFCPWWPTKNMGQASVRA